LKSLPNVLERDFWEIYQLILKVDPDQCGGFPNHALKGKLKGYCALEIGWNGAQYRTKKEKRGCQLRQKRGFMESYQT